MQNIIWNYIWKNNNPFSPINLFTDWEQGTWYDPSDLTTMFQDSAGTIPITAVEQPVGRILDKSGKGNHTSQATSASRPVLSARVNLLTMTEDFGDVIWSKGNTTVTQNEILAPDGTMTADKLIETAVTGAHHLSSPATLIDIDKSYVVSIYLKKSTYKYVAVSAFKDANNNAGAVFNLDDFTFVSGGIGTGFTATDVSAVSVGNGWYRCFFKVTAGIQSAFRVHHRNIPYVSGSLYAGYAGSTDNHTYIWGASVVPADQASLPYQRVNTATDYDTVGFPKYLKFDGVDDSLATNSIDFSATDEMTVWGGVRKLSDANNAIFAELSAIINTNNGAFYLTAPHGSAAPGYGFSSKGTAQATAIKTTGYAAPISSIITGAAKISTDSAKLRINGYQVSQRADDQGTGNYGNYPIYIGARGGTSLFFNWLLYWLIIRWKTSTDTEIIKTEKYLNKKTLAY